MREAMVTPQLIQLREELQELANTTTTSHGLYQTEGKSFAPTVPTDPGELTLQLTEYQRCLQRGGEMATVLRRQLGHVIGLAEYHRYPTQ